MGLGLKPGAYLQLHAILNRRMAYCSFALGTGGVVDVPALGLVAAGKVKFFEIL